jgi:hypothetical protein
MKKTFYPLAVLSVVLVAIALLVSSCTIPQVSVEDRTFLNLSLEFLDEYRLPKTTLENTPVGGLSGLVYDRTRDRFLAVSDDRSEFAAARFYTLKLNLAATEQPTIASVTVEKVTPLLTEDGKPYPKGTLDPEGIVITPRQTVMISSEGVARDQIKPFIDEFDLETGQWRNRLPIPERFNPKEVDSQRYGVRDNYGFEALTLMAASTTGAQVEPFRVFAGAESALYQDLPPDVKLDPVPDGAEIPPLPTIPLSARFLHYLVGDLPTLISEHLYPLDAPVEGATFYGLTELFALDQGGHFLSIERTFRPGSGIGAKLYQIATGGATDISNITRLRGNTNGITPIQKRLVSDLGTLGVKLGNLEGIAYGPRLPDGSQSLVIVGDDNFSDEDLTQFLLFRVRTGQGRTSS